MQAPLIIKTERLLLRKPEDADKQEIFERYACDAEVCRFLAWPMHRTVDDTAAFIEFSDAMWAEYSTGPYLICLRSTRQLLGSTGLELQADNQATTGYVLAKDAWGNGYATESLIAMCNLAAELGVSQVSTSVYPAHAASRHVLEKAGFAVDATLSEQFEFPNLKAGEMVDVVSYFWRPDR